MIGEILLWLFVTWLAIQQGGGLYESRAIVPLWSRAAPAEMEAALERSGQKTAGYRFWPFVSPPVALLAVANAVVAWNVPAPRGTWWLAASMLAVAYSLATYTYFVPTMFRLWKASTMPDDEVRRAVRWWVGLGPLRQVAGILALLTALKALSCGG